MYTQKIRRLRREVKNGTIETTVLADEVEYGTRNIAAWISRSIRHSIGCGKAERLSAEAQW